MIDIKVTYDFKADIADVFNSVSDHVNFLSTANIQCKLLHTGQHQPNGLGAWREVSSGALCFEEEITGFHAPDFYDYRIRSLRGPFGITLPFQHEHGRIELSNKNGATHVIWTSRFHFRIPLIGNWLDKKIGRQIENTFLFFLKRLDARLAKQHSDGSR